MEIRQCQPSDHPAIISVMKDWWGGRDLTYMLPRLFLNHFYKTSFVVELEDKLVGFLVGFLSPSEPDEGYIHFAGVDPPHHGKGIGIYLYHQFFQLCRKDNRNIVKACTSPVNKDSIAFHTHIGFSIKPGNTVLEGVQVTLDYNKPDDPKVLFIMDISKWATLPQ